MHSPVPSGQIGGTHHVQGRERRASVRYLTTMEAACHPVLVQTLGPCCPTRIWDISLNGLGLIVKIPFAVGTNLSVVPEVLPANLYPGLQVRVVHVTPHDEGFWLVGCQFLEPLSEEELQLLLG